MSTNIRDVLRRFGPTTGTLLLSQAISAVSLFLLPLLGSSVSDIYAIGFQTGVGPFNGLVMGVIYLVALGRPDFSAWRQAVVSVIIFSTLVTSYSVVNVLRFTTNYDYSTVSRVSIIVIFGVGSGALGGAGVFGVRHACLGRAWVLAGIMIPSNLSMLFATTAVYLLPDNYEVLLFLPALAWSASACLVAALLSRYALPTATLGSEMRSDETRRNRNLHLSGLIIGLISSTIVPVGLVAATNQLASGTTTMLFLANRIGNAIVGVFVNAILMVKVNWKNTTRKKSRYYYMGPLVAALIVACSFALREFGAVASYGAVVVGWLIVTSSTPVILREANVNRFGMTILSKSGLDMLASVCVLFYFARNPSATGFFGATMLSQYITNIVCGWSFRDRYLVVSAFGGLLVSLLLIIRGW